MAEEDEAPPEDGTLRAFGNTLSGWARRVGELVAEVSGQPMVPEAVREPLATARTLRLVGECDSARTLLLETRADHSEEPHVALALGLTLVHELLLHPLPTAPSAAAQDGLAEIARSLEDSEELGSAAGQLLSGAVHLARGELDKALDQLRRAARDPGRLTTEEQTEVAFLLHVLAGLAHERRGNPDRALRELQKARVRLPTEAGDELRGLVLSRGVDLLLVEAHVTDAETWLRSELAEADGALADRGQELLARTLAAKGDAVAARAILETLGDVASDATRVRVGLHDPSASTLADTRAVALRYLQQQADDHSRARIWALAELAADADDDEGGPVRGEILAALTRAFESAPQGSRDRHLHELAHVTLRLGLLEDTVLSAISARLDDDPATAPEELRLVRVRHQLVLGEAPPAEDFAGEPPRFRVRTEAGGPWGPDAVSPLRDDDLRSSVLTSQRSLVSGELCLSRNLLEAAQDHLVAALIETPTLRRAHERLADLARPPGEPRLEALLGSATTLLAAVPNRVLGVPLVGVQEALPRVVAARERLARPLTIAIMGEFSSGKSTFVNVLLGEAVAPMGVLPTTTTINVFRRGPSGGARVHYRDGRLATLAADDVQSFLHGLDDVEASKIRHVEIERTGPRMGDAAVVDTPGLNSLDTFHEQVAREFLDEADAVVWIFSATRGGAASEAGMLSSLRASGRQVLGVLNKVDTLSEDEQAELSAYLREQLGDVLVEIAPLCARDALEYRTKKQRDGDDPFAPVEKALETHFLRRARDLKRSLTKRRLCEALEAARNTVAEVADALDARAAQAAAARGPTVASADTSAQRFAERVQAGLLDLDDLLTREAMGAGIVRPGQGLAKGPLDPQDVIYLETVLRDGALAVLQRALNEVARGPDGSLVGDVLERLFVPWAHGYLDGELAGGFMTRTLSERGRAASQGEAAVRAELRVAIEPMATAWRARARGLARDIERAQARAQRHAASTPRAEAVRLRTAVAAGIDALHRAAEDLET